MLPLYTIQHVRQELGFEGLNLARKRHTEILKRTPEINAKSIRNLGDARYSVQSVTNSSHWPRVELCKHVTAVAHFFGNGGQQIEVEVAPKTAQVQAVQEGSVHVRSEASATAILENVIALSRAFLSDGTVSSPETVRSLQMVETHLTAIVQNACSPESPLPDKDALPPNQGTWTKTTERMGAKRHQKRPCPATMSPPEPPATERIRGLNRKKPCVKIMDPYGGGLSSGQDTPPDARSATQNTEARTRAAAAANNVNHPPSQPLKRGPQYVGVPALSVPTSSVPLPPPAPHMWYPIPNAYPPGMPSLGLLTSSVVGITIMSPVPSIPRALSIGLYLTIVVSQMPLDVHGPGPIKVAWTQQKRLRQSLPQSLTPTRTR
ncbi:hypothetical protein EDB89DRAFT_2077796 [Lactarius sanguifluus]|nr:hypothetical protein EDB89DRAFT_2077796 [Lactarius sanguifluus]